MSDASADDAPRVVTSLTGDAFAEAALEMLSPLALHGYRRVRTRARAIVLATERHALVLAVGDGGVVQFEAGERANLFIDDADDGAELAPEDEPLIALDAAVSGFRVLALGGVTVGPLFEGFAADVRAALEARCDAFFGPDPTSAYGRAVAEEERLMAQAAAEADATERAALVAEWRTGSVRVRELRVTDDVWSMLGDHVEGARPSHLFIVALPIGNAVVATRDEADALATAWGDEAL